MTAAVRPAEANVLLDFVVRYYTNAALFVEEVLGMDGRDADHTIDPDQRQVLDWVSAGERRISVRSGHGVGKSTTLAWLIVWHNTIRFPQKTLCTAPTSSQLFDALASEAKAWFRRLPPPIAELFEIKTDAIVLLSAPNESFTSFATSRAETPEALSGKHSANMLVIADEASGVPEQVFEAAFGSMSGHQATMILAGNPVRTSGLFFDTHHRLSDKWKTLRISCVGHPRIGEDFITEARETYGEDSNAYRVRVLGEFPRAEDDAVIPFELIEAAYNRDVRPTMVRPIWGLDVAYTGNDRSALAKRKGNTLMEKVQTWKGLDTMQLSGVIHNEWKDTPIDLRPQEILVDSIGYGAGVADRLREMGLPARGVNVSELPALKSRYGKLRDELYLLGREWFDARDCNIRDDRSLGKELGAVHYLPPDSSGKVRVEPTDRIRKTLRGASPDLGSAFILTFAGTASSALYGSKNASSWNEPIRRKIAGIV